MSSRGHHLRINLFILIYWVASLIGMTMLAMFSIQAFLDFSEIDISDNTFAVMYLSPAQYLESGLFGLFFGIWFIVVNRLSDRWRLERLGFGRTILARSGIYLLGFFIIMVLVYQIIDSLGHYPEEFLSSLALGPNLRLMMAAVLMTIIGLILLLNFILQSVKNTGYYNLESFLTGKYRQPMVEDRTFLFLDLKGSTSHAERLGYLVYGQMVKDCMDDINVLLSTYEAQVYQYVGDEVILTWKTDDAIKNLNFVEIFYAFDERLRKRANYYRKKYDTLPVFKAGANSGRVTATEIGVIKRDLAFYGDVLNTASRLQDQCNSLDRRLLISGNLKHQIGNIYSVPYQFEFMGNKLLKGKQDSIDIFAILQKQEAREIPIDGIRISG